MTTTNLPELIHELDKLGQVSVHDTLDGIELLVGKPVNVHEMDDLICDALIADPLGRTESQNEWTIRLYKRESLRGASDMRVVRTGDTSEYMLERAA